MTRMAALLDVNVLVALFDPAHVCHEAAHTWLRRSRERGWATCPLTENGMVRVLANPAYPGSRTTVDDATRRLRQFCAHGRHTFWPDAVSWREERVFRLPHVQGHRQLTDVYLLALAVRNKGCLATFDDTIPIHAVAGATKGHLALIGA